MWLTGIIFLLLEEDNRFVRFHAMQSIMVFLPLTIIGWILSALAGAFWMITMGNLLFISLSWLVWLLVIVLWLVLMFKAYSGEKFKLPIVGDFAEEQISK